jgi:DNA repair ATPase RecN
MMPFRLLLGRDVPLSNASGADAACCARAEAWEDAFDASALASVAARTDALGILARRFATMAEMVRAREERLRAEVRELRTEIDQARQSKKVAEITETDFLSRPSVTGRGAAWRP